MNRIDQPEIERTIRSMGDRMAESVLAAGETMQHLAKVAQQDCEDHAQRMREASQVVAERMASFSEHYARWMGIVFSNGNGQKQRDAAPPTAFPRADD